MDHLKLSTRARAPGGPGAGGGEDECLLAELPRPGGSQPRLRQPHRQPATDPGVRRRGRGHRSRPGRAAGGGGRPRVPDLLPALDQRRARPGATDAVAGRPHRRHDDRLHVPVGRGRVQGARPPERRRGRHPAVRRAHGLERAGHLLEHPSRGPRAGAGVRRRGALRRRLREDAGRARDGDLVVRRAHRARQAAGGRRRRQLPHAPPNGPRPRATSPAGAATT